MKIFDTHVHLGLLSEDKIETLIAIKSANMNNVVRFMTIANSITDFDKVYNMLKEENGVYFAIGISPSDTEFKTKAWEKEVYSRAKLKNVIAIGETGLDYLKQFGDKKSQVELFISQIKISNELKKPLIIHNRTASEDIFDVLKNKQPAQNMVYHCFSSTYKFAQESVNHFKNLYVSFAGNVTYKNQKDLFDCVKNLPVDRIVVESESPFMVPISQKGARNKPEYITETIAFIAKTRGIEEQEMAKILWENSNRLFGLEDN